jgi:glycosyltransferase involved in cell wall biosynthesis/GT2 family glycosyltransferase
MPEHDPFARVTLRLATQPGAADGPPWAVFDPEWYRIRYSDAPKASGEAASPNESGEGTALKGTAPKGTAPKGTAEELLEWHLARGQSLGHSPNRYFDEEWQRRTWPGIADLIDAGSVESAFHAWCGGPRATRPPHWLFSPADYRDRYPGMTEEILAASGFVNRYHHYLSFGAAEGRIGHPLFDPAIYLASLDRAEAETAAAMPFRHYLQGLENGAPERPTSVLFDVDWYRERYPDAVRAVAAGEFGSLLQHYLCNDRPTEFDPSPWFSEEHYLGENPGLAESVGSNGFRNGFVHFLEHGSREGRSPHPDLDLAWYAARDEVRADLAAKRAPDAFTHWITVGYSGGLSGRPSVEVRITEAQAIALYRRRAQTIWPLYGRHKLDFSHDGKPSVSVVMALRNSTVETMVSLASLRSQYLGGIDLILIDSDPALRGEDIELYVTGATVLRFGSVLNNAAAREAGLICATAEAILFLGDGIELAPGALEAALKRLQGDTAIGIVGGRIVQPHGVLLEAGGIIWREGQLLAYARDASPSAPEANFVRNVDYCSSSFLLARRDVLSLLPDQAGSLAGTTHDAADLCVRVQLAGFRVVCDPDVLAFLTAPPSDRAPNGRPAFIAEHGEYLATRPAFDRAALIWARTPDEEQTRILYIEDSVPVRRLGSGFVRSNDVLRTMAAAGAAVTVFPMKGNMLPLSTVRADLPDTIEVMHDRSSADFSDFFAARHGYYDVIWVARTHNLDQLHGTIARFAAAAAPADALAADFDWRLDAPASQVGSEEPGAGSREDPGRPLTRLNLVTSDGALTFPSRNNIEALSDHGKDLSGRGSPDRSMDIPRVVPRVVIDTEAVASVRQAGQAKLMGQPFDMEEALTREFRNLDPAMNVVAVTDAEAAIVRAHHGGAISVLGHAIPAAPTPRPFEERTGMLFVGAIHGMDHPNYDGLAWFIDEVLPLIERTLRWETRLTVAGYTAPDVTLDRFRSHPRVTLRGAVSDLVSLYDANRVFIAPARFAAGIPYKVHEAAAFGLPVVATTLLSGQLGWRDAEAIGAADITDPAGFAARVIALHRDAVLWARIRNAALARVTAELDPGPFATKVAELSRRGTAVPDIAPERGIPGRTDGSDLANVAQLFRPNV